MSLQNDSSQDNPLLNYFIKNGGRSIHKWVDYFEVYHRTLARFRGKPVKFLEIGIQNGGSAHMWRDYLGEHATVVGVDIDPACKSLELEGFEVFIGDQSNPDFLRSIVTAHPRFDIVLDDGGHTMDQQITSFLELFSVLNDGGVYICEDTHTSYFPTHGGGITRSGTFHEFVKNLLDQMHAWYYAPLADLDNEVKTYFAHHIYSINIYDSIVVIEKRRKNPPLSLARGAHGHILNPPAMDFLELRRRCGINDQ